jgi:hypothetical protein
MSETKVWPPMMRVESTFGYQHRTAMETDQVAGAIHDLNQILLVSCSVLPPRDGDTLALIPVQATP